MAKVYESAKESWTEYRAARQDMIRTANVIDAGDPMHPLATNEFSKQIKRVQVIDNEIKIFKPEKV